jgi:hypothetical protein
MRGADVMAARAWPADAKGLVVAIDAQEYRPLVVLRQAIQALPCPDGGLKRADAYFTYIAGLPADQIAAIANATGITPAGVLAAGNNCAARIALDGEVDKDKQTADRRPDRTQQEGLERGRQRRNGQAAPRHELSGELQIANRLVAVPPWRNVRPAPRRAANAPIQTARPWH